MPFPMKGSRAGFTLLELALVLAVSGVVAAVGLRQAHRWLDRAGTRAAVLDAALTVADARDAALAGHALVTVRVDTVAGVLSVASRGRRIAVRALAHEYGVRLSTTRDSITFGVRGLGYGAANLTVVARRGSATDTMVVSRLGRVR